MTLSKLTKKVVFFFNNKKTESKHYKLKNFGYVKSL